ncbi:MAG: hypothetical protein JWP44_4533 [Mucilaginibacter sp.]|nr:hypothetical protein [Mucilaginibacter sp.]
MTTERRSPGRMIGDAILQSIASLTDRFKQDPSPNQIAQELGLSRQRVHAQIRRLEGAGLVERRSGGHAIHLTEQGRKALAATRTEVDPERLAIRERILEAVRALQAGGTPANHQAIVLHVLAQELPAIQEELDAMVADGTLRHENGEYSLPD